MMQFTCDMCGRNICTETERRYVVRLEMYPVESDLEIQKMDLDIDPIDLMQQLIESNFEPPKMEFPQVENKRYDMCPECYEAYQADPLGKSGRRKIHFSPN